MKRYINKKNNYGLVEKIKQVKYHVRKYLEMHAGGHVCEWVMYVYEPCIKIMCVQEICDVE